MNILRRKFLRVAAGAVALPAMTRIAWSQAYPVRTITLIVPFPPGGSTDPVGRIMAASMAEKLGQPIIVENVGGAGGSIGVGRLAHAVPDGYTIDIGQWDTHVLNGVVYNLNYDLRTDFTPIGLVSLNPVLLVARKAFPADNLKTLVAWMRAHPGETRFGNGSAATRLGGFLLEKLSGAKMLFVPYRGAGPAMTDLIGGQIDLLIVQAAGGIRRCAPARSKLSQISRRTAPRRYRASQAPTSPACPDFIWRAGSACSRQRARRRTPLPRSTRPW